jgi:hypothetical protein
LPGEQLVTGGPSVVAVCCSGAFVTLNLALGTLTLQFGYELLEIG